MMHHLLTFRNIIRHIYFWNFQCVLSGDMHSIYCLVAIPLANIKEIAS